MTPEERYTQMKAFVVTFSELCMGLDRFPAEVAPRVQIERLEGKGRRIARKGVEQAFNDCIEMSRDLMPADVEKLDAHLSELRLPALADFQRMFSKKYAAVVKRGRIRTATEFYLLRNVVDAPRIQDEERKKVRSMLDEYEFEGQRT